MKYKKGFYFVLFDKNYLVYYWDGKVLQFLDDSYNGYNWIDSMFQTLKDVESDFDKQAEYLGE